MRKNHPGIVYLSVLSVKREREKRDLIDDFRADGKLRLREREIYVCICIPYDYLYMRRGKPFL